MYEIKFLKDKNASADSAHSDATDALPQDALIIVPVQARQQLEFIFLDEVEQALQLATRSTP